MPKREKPTKESKKARERETIERVLSVGAAAKVKLYHSYLSRIGRGEMLRPSEVKHFRQLESELESQAGNGNGNGPRGNIIISMDDAAAYVGCSRKTISVNIKRGRLKQNPDGTFSRPELDRFLARCGRHGSSEQSEPIRIHQDKAELRFRLARARREEMIVEQMKKNLVSWKEVETEWSGRIRELTSSLRAFADRLAGLIVGKGRDQVHEIIKAEVRTIMENYSRVGKYTPEV